jgi:hypothetical protein
MSAIPGYLTGKTGQEEDDGECRHKQNDQNDEGKNIQDHLTQTPNYRFSNSTALNLCGHT